MKILTILALVLSASSAFADTPKRIVSTSGNASEVIVLFGLTDRLVAVDTTSLIPADVMKKKPKIGYRRHLSAEGILSMSPDLVILAPDAGPAAVVDQLKNSGIPLFFLEDKQTLDGINHDILRLGKVLGVEDRAEKLVKVQKAQEVALAKSVAAYPRKPKIIALLDTGQGAFGLGDNSAGEHIIRILGGVPALKFSGMKPISDEKLATSDADVILVASRPDNDDQHVVKPLAKGRYKAIDLNSTVKKGCVFQVDIMKTLGFGPNTADTARQIADAILPCVQGK